jgi:DNA-directed RNA polymerase subunit F
MLFMKELEKIKPRHWHEILREILSLEKQYDKVAIDLSCGRALSYEAINYMEVKRILEQKLYQQDPEGGQHRRN